MKSSEIVEKAYAAVKEKCKWIDDYLEALAEMRGYRGRHVSPATRYYDLLLSLLNPNREDYYYRPPEEWINELAMAIGDLRLMNGGLLRILTDEDPRSLPTSILRAATLYKLASICSIYGEHNLLGSGKKLREVFKEWGSYDVNRLNYIIIMTERIIENESIELAKEVLSALGVKEPERFIKEVVEGD